MLSKLIATLTQIIVTTWKKLKGKKRNIALLIMVLQPVLLSFGVPVPDEATITALILGAVGVLDNFGAFKPLIKLLKELLR